MKNQQPQPQTAPLIVCPLCKEPVGQAQTEKMDELAEYRATLIASEQHAIDTFDEKILTLSAGALGVSFAFIKDLVRPENMVQEHLLLTAWVLWGISIVAVLLSFYLSHLAMRHAAHQVDAGTIQTQSPGGVLNRIVLWLNPAAGGAFVVALGFLVYFVAINLPNAKANNNAPQQGKATAQQNTNSP